MILAPRSDIMPSFEGSLSDEEIEDIIRYLHSVAPETRLCTIRESAPVKIRTCKLWKSRECKCESASGNRALHFLGILNSLALPTELERAYELFGQKVIPTLQHAEV